jgi:transcriptional regulator with XRE-family HTH domain
MEWMAEQGRRLKAARVAKGMTVEHLADMTGGDIKASRISNYEQGTRGMKPPQAIMLAKLLDVSPAYLLTLTEDADLSERERALLELFRKADDRGKTAITRLAESECQASVVNHR